MKIKEMKGWLLNITKGNVIGITLAPFGVFLKKNYLDDKEVIRHESIHWRQQMEMLIIPFYVWYGVEWGIKYLFYGRTAYYYISFEKEAYLYDYDPDYLKTRTPYSWLRWVFNCK